MNTDFGIDNGYELYRKTMKRDARRIFSRFNLGLFAFTAVSYVSIFIIEIALMILLGEKFNDLLGNVYFTTLLSIAPLYVFGLPMLVAIVSGMPKKKLEKSKIPFSEFIVIFLIAQFLMSIGNVIGNALNFIFSRILNKEITNSTSELIDEMPIWLMTLLVVIIVPLAEEFIFRKLMIDRLSRCGNVIAILVSSVAFALFHGNFYQFFYACFVGFVLGYVYVRSGRLIYSYILHALLNFLGSVALMPIIKMSEELTVFFENISNGVSIDIERFIMCAMGVSSYSIVQNVTVLAGLVLFVTVITKKLIKIKSDPVINIPREDVASVTLLNVGTILFIGVSLIVFAASIFLV